MSKSTTTAPVAATVRAFFLADPKRLDRLSEQGQANVRATRGRLSQEVTDVFNKGRRNKYVQGATSAATAAAKADAAAKRAALADSGVTVGARGPLPGSVRKPRAATSKA